MSGILPVFAAPFALPQVAQPQSLPVFETKPSIATQLPNELVTKIFSSIQGDDCANTRLVCKQWNFVSAGIRELKIIQLLNFIKAVHSNINESIPLDSNQILFIKQKLADFERIRDSLPSLKSGMVVLSIDDLKEKLLNILQLLPHTVLDELGLLENEEYKNLLIQAKFYKKIQYEYLVEPDVSLSQASIFPIAVEILKCGNFRKAIKLARPFTDFKGFWTMIVRELLKVNCVNKAIKVASQIVQVNSVKFFHTDFSNVESTCYIEIMDKLLENNRCEEALAISLKVNKPHMKYIVDAKLSLAFAKNHDYEKALSLADDIGDGVYELKTKIETVDSIIKQLKEYRPDFMAFADQCFNLFDRGEVRHAFELSLQTTERIYTKLINSKMFYSVYARCTGELIVKEKFAEAVELAAKLPPSSCVRLRDEISQRMRRRIEHFLRNSIPGKNLRALADLIPNEIIKDSVLQLVEQKEQSEMKRSGEGLPEPGSKKVHF